MPACVGRRASAAVRLFGGSGSVSPQDAWNGVTTVSGTQSFGAPYGTGLDGATVNSIATFNAAVAQLRTFAGHDPNQAGSWTNSPNWRDTSNFFGPRSTCPQHVAQPVLIFAGNLR